MVLEVQELTKMDYVSNAIFNDKIENAIILVSLPTCATCRAVERFLESPEFDDTLKYKVKADSEVIKQLPVSSKSLPIILFYKNGTVVKNYTGFVRASVLSEAVKEVYGD